MKALKSLGIVLIQVLVLVSSILHVIGEALVWGTNTLERVLNRCEDSLTEEFK